jgi:hypothetical protein
MTNGKSPGSDGYTVDFYKFFWEDIGPLLYRSLYLAYNQMLSRNLQEVKDRFCYVV